MAEESNSLEFTPTWVVAIVFLFVALISLCAERCFDLLQMFKWMKQFKPLEKLKDVLLLLVFLSLQYAITRICIPSDLASHMLPCKKETVSPSDTSSKHCSKGKVPLFSQEALDDLQLFLLVLAVVHVIFCVTTMVLGRGRMSRWKSWEDSTRDKSKSEKAPSENKDSHKWHFWQFISERAFGYWKNSAVVSWLISFFKQFHHSISKSDYITLRQGFITAHCGGDTEFDFHGYMVRVIERDFTKVVGISWYLWLFVVIFLLLNLEGLHTYFWLAFLPLILLLLVGAKLEHIITRMAQDADQNKIHHQTGLAQDVDQNTIHHQTGLAQDVDQNKIHHRTDGVHPSDKYFWFGRPGIVLHLIHFILFQNSFEIAFFIWIWWTYGFHSCMMEKLGYIIARLIISVIVQVLCSYSTLPLYALVGHMGSKFRFDTFNEFREASSQSQARQKTSKMQESNGSGTQMQKMNRESYEHVQVAEEIVVIEAATS